MAKLQPVTQNNNDGKTVKGYKIALRKKGVLEESGFTEDDELEIEYKKEKIIITKKKD